MSGIINDLISLSHELGVESRQLAILGEGNTSADCGDGTFWVKASGSQLGNITEAGFSRCRMEAVLDLVKRESMSDEEVRKALTDVLVDPQARKPSVETFMHALCLSVGGAKWVAHTHPISCNGILCSKFAAEPFLQHMFPDAIVVCGRDVAVVPYVDPGFLLAKVVYDELRRFQDRHGSNPKLLLMINHGITALGQTATEAFNIQLMADKWAKTLLATYALGGPNYLPSSQSDRIENRPDEHYRRRALTK